MTKELAITTIEKFKSEIDSLTQDSFFIWRDKVLDNVRIFMGDDNNLYKRLSYLNYNISSEKEKAKQILSSIIEYIDLHGIIQPEEPEEAAHDSHEKVGRTVWDFIKENLILSISILIFILCLLGYLITHQYGVKVPGFELTPPNITNNNKQPLKTDSINEIKAEDNFNHDVMEIISWYKKVDNDYQAQQLAKKIYYGKHIKYEGVINDIVASYPNKIDFMLPNVVASFDAKGKATTFNKGDKIVFSGRIQQINGLVFIDSCMLIDKP